MAIRYCIAQSKRTHQPCRARAMRGMEVCYHHGGKSRRGIAHPNHKHGFYCKTPDMWLMVLFNQYRHELHRQQAAIISRELIDNLPTSTPTDYKRLRAALTARLLRIPRPKLTAALAAELRGVA